MKEKILKVLDFVIPAVCAIIVICGALYIFSVNKEYNAAKSEYSGIVEMAVTADDYEGATDIGETDASNDDGSTDDKGEEAPSKPRETFRNLNIDFASLKEINEETVGWVYIPTLDNVNYPVVQTGDNVYYTEHTFEKEANPSGAIFMDSQNYPDFSEYNTFVYGHNMNNKTMFGQLKRFIKEEGIFEHDPYVFYYTEDHAYKFRIFAYYVTTNGSKVYRVPVNEEQYDDYISYVSGLNQYEKGREIDLSSRPIILTLSTCAGARTNRRTIIQSYLIDEYDIADAK